MGVGNDAYRSVTDSDACKLVGHYHAALNVHVGIHETRHNVGPWGLFGGQFTASHLDDGLTLNHQLAVEYLATNHVNNVSFDVFHILSIFD